MLPILPLKRLELDSPERRLAQFLNAWASRDWERMARNCVAAYRKNPAYATQRLKQFFGQRPSTTYEQGIAILSADKNKGVDLISAAIVLSKSKGPYAKVAVNLEFVRCGNKSDTFGEVFTFELIREIKATGKVDPLGEWFVVPKFEVYSEQCFDVDNIFGAATPEQMTDRQHVEPLQPLSPEVQE